MQCNVGNADRLIRVILSAMIVIFGVSFQSWWGLVGLIPFVTAALGWCPAYVPFGMSSCKK